jgi:HprK-related kinase A
MRVQDLPMDTLAHCLRGDGLHLDTGAFTTHLRIDVPALVADFAAMYAHYPLVDPAGIDDFQVRIGAPSLLRRLVRPQVVNWVDDEQLIEPLPLDQALPCLESALNLAVAYLDVAPLIVHSAVLERDGRALVMPAPSGSGKSTLCAALAWRGWRLMSDEMAIFCCETGHLRANPRPVSLKNHAVEVIRAFEPRARFSRIYAGTSKGDIAYMQAPPHAVARAHDNAAPGLLVAPMFRAGAAVSVREMDRDEGFRWLTDNSINYASLLQYGFDTVTRFIEHSGLYTLTYSNLDEAIDTINTLHQRHTGR